ncbi:RNA polymerase sigma-54 factor [Catalinimonas alkaloidigena]|uniref:RNA polymerase sigma-54 factor n=1 Tax=Catalinimonas alkaloidigena TaxID=1075417 RepID=A0A1G9D505_9BACT|nr:RNA polymerase factor sigma-54 [Catalinimonas alkaloidigena]SDK58913.1 RNA polymerase sigma-54 factor [Catalinimonas alkaloidigena]
MQKLGLNQTLSQKLSPQQIQFIKLLQIPTAELMSRVEQELESNPALEEGREEPESSTDEYDDLPDDDYSAEEEINLDDYLRDDDIAGYKMQGDGPNPDDDDREMPIARGTSLTESLLTQLDYLPFDERRKAIGRQLIGSIESDGYIRRDLESIANDLAFSQNIDTTPEEVERILLMIQQFDPPGIAARDLQECLVLQLERRTDNYEVAGLALQIVEECFDEFTKKHYEKIQRKLDVDDQDLLRDAINMITRLNPKPGEVTSGNVKTQYIIPDYILTENNGKLELSLNSRNAPELKISRSYADLLDTYDKSDKKDKKIKETVTFVKQKLDAAKWFIDAIKQRQQTLLKTMNAIIRYQYDFFLTGDESRLKPMILKDIAGEIGMDISTVSRVANSKFVQTEFGVYPLKYFFSEGIATDSGEDASSREVKAVLKEMIDKENKSRPLSDDKLGKMLQEKGYNIARRTVAKYREQLNIPVARLRKEL